MKTRILSELTNEELLQESKKIKSARILNAVLIGFLIGIIVYSVARNTLGLFTLIPLFFVYKLINKDRHDSKEIQRLLKERNLQ